MHIIAEDVGQIKLGNLLLPGIYQSMDISRSVRVDEVECPGRSGKAKQPMGFEDAVINLSLVIPTNEGMTCYERLKVLVETFQSIDGNGKPYVYNIVNRLTDLWGIKQVIFKDIRVKDDNVKKDSVQVDLVFHEYSPVMVLTESRRTDPDLLAPFTDFSQPVAESPGLSVPAESPGTDDDAGDEIS